MPSRLNPYLNFDGNAREAMEFYAKALGGELHVNTFGDFPGADDATKDQIMHAMLETPVGFTLMASDLPPGSEGLNRGDDISISLSGEDDAELRGYWDKLSKGGTVTMPLEKQMWGDTFGMFTDKFGIKWMVNITQGG